MYSAYELGYRITGDTLMAKLFEFFGNQRKILQQQKEIAQLKTEVEKLRTENTSMRDGMRRCITCDYRIDFKQRQTNRHDNTTIKNND
jgi:cell division protein FtsB